ncbi:MULTISPECIES: MBL fold metallo-hydrolase [unclassified Clostridium]|uniref:MBL fold metallo-hydrolase n=1 Tax=unclassified Clostridium TaxID=2614128 RepID=UPI0020793446|nr:MULTISPECIES: MBL fold metallo-hydrolase [unclassified Clostridium]MBN1039388.1 MBL fold metallo-hydrolase [Clostridium botulinum]
MSLKITTLIENNSDENNILINEHGLSLYIKMDEIKILFDTGQSGDFIKNAEKLKINLNNLDYVILSHGHYDHSGGFKKFVKNTKNSFKLIVGNGFFSKKYKLIESNLYKFNGNSFDEKFININNISTKYIVQDSFNLTEDIILFSNFERNTDFEILNKKFHIKQNGEYIPDDFCDEISLAIKTEKGLVVILGCSHVGIVNILKTIIKRTGMRIYCVVGGSHLIEADELRLNNTIKFLKENDIQVLRLSHCTGENTIRQLKYEFGNKFVYNNTGNNIFFKK